MTRAVLFLVMSVAVVAAGLGTFILREGDSFDYSSRSAAPSGSHFSPR